MANKTYYWMKLQEDFFSSKRIKKLRRLAGGDTFTIIYLKMQLMSVRNGGILKYSGLEQTFAEELALDMDEEPENVAVVLQYLASTGLIETSDNIEYLLPYAAMNIGSETESAIRMRRSRARKAEEASLCDNNVQQCANIVPQCDSTRDLTLTLNNTQKDLDVYKDKSNNSKSNRSRTRVTREEDAHKYGEYGWVKLTDAQYEKLSLDLGIEELQRCIKYIDELAQSSGNKNEWKDWNLVIRRCHREGWGKRGYGKNDISAANKVEQRINDVVGSIWGDS